MYTIAIRQPYGAWEHRTNGTTARECKRSLAKRLGVAQSMLESIPPGKRVVTGIGIVKLEKR